MGYLCLSLLVLVLLLVCVCFLLHRKHLKMLNRLDSMLDKAAENEFSESEFSESRLSKTESKMYRYLSAGKTSLRQINSEKDAIKALISDISHQTKTPISNILLYSELLCDTDGMDEKTRLLAESIRAQTEKLSFLIGSLIKISRLENGIVSLSPKENSIQRLLQGLALEPQASAKGIELQIDTGTAVTAVFDLKWTREAIANIVDNAIKYTQSGGTVCVSAVSYEMFAKIDITDNGIGISEEEIPKIFARFYRSRHVSDEDGVGIGLYLAREIITRQGGYIKVNSSVGIGSTFSVFIPKKANMSKV